MFISVTADKEGAGLENIHIDDIMFLETSQNRIMVHTRDSVYYVANTLERWLKALQSTGHHFELVDRSCVADLSKVKRIDSKWGRLFFNEDASSPGKPCNIAMTNFKQIVNKIEKLNHL
jgi:DNA-binding LytR/AlgR family response regulator